MASAGRFRIEIERGLLKSSLRPCRGADLRARAAGMERRGVAYPVWAMLVPGVLRG